MSLRLAPHSRGSALVLFALIVLAPVGAFAQRTGGGVSPNAACPPEGCITGVAVTPDGGTISQNRNTTGTATFTVRNTGNVTTSFTFSCIPTSVTCGTVTPASASIAAGAIREVDVSYTIGTVNGRVTMKATNGGTATDNGFFNITALAPKYLVDVTPDVGHEPTRETFSGPFSVTFTVKNTGDSTDTFALTCSTTGTAACGTVTPASVTLASFAQTTASVNYTVGGPSSASVQLNALGRSSDAGSYLVTVVAPPRAPIVSTAPSNGTFRSLVLCSASCFDAIWTHVTPSYFSMGVGRAFALTYSSAMARPTPVLSVNVSNVAGHTPTTYSAQVKLTASGVALTLLNGGQTVYYGALGTDTTRLVLPVDAVANALATGWYDVSVAVTSNYGTDSSAMTVQPGRLLVDNETASPFGLGIGVSGLQQVYTQSGSFGAMVTEGNGTVAFYDRACSGCAYVTPNGTSAGLSSPSGVPWRRTYLDGSYVDFNSSGRMVKQADRYGNATTLWYTGTQLDSIVDPMGKALSLTFLSGKLQRVTDPAGRATNYTIDGTGRLTRVTDVDNKFITLAYSATGLLTRVTDRDGQAMDLTYDAMNRSDSTLSKSTTFYTGTMGRSVTLRRSADRQVWQPARAGTSAASAKLAIRYDTVYALLTDPIGGTTKVWLDRFGAPTKIIDVLGRTTTIARDTMSRPTLVTQPSGHQIKTTYSNYLVASVQDVTTSRTVSFTYNSRNDVISISGGTAPQTLTYHNGSRGPAGALDTVKVGGFVLAVHYPDSRGRDTLIVHGDSTHKTRLAYDPTWGTLIRTTDPQGNVTRVHLDAAGRSDTSYAADGGAWGSGFGPLNEVTATKNPLGQTTQYQYDPNLAVQRIVDPKGQIYRFTHNALGILTAAFDLADTLKAVTYGYDAAGRLRKVTSRKGEVVNTTYDALGRILSRSGTGFASQAFAYDASGRWAVASNAHAYDSLAFDAAGRVVKDFQKLNGTMYEWRLQYDGQDRVQTRQLFLGGVAQSPGYQSRTFTSSGFLSNTSIAGLSVSTDPGTSEELPVRRTINPGVGSFWMGTVYSKDHVPVRDSFSVKGLDSLFGHQVTYDSLDRLTTVLTGTMSGPFFTVTFQDKYRYDRAGRLVKACKGITQPGTNCTDEYGSNPFTTDSYTYDAAGNRTEAAAGAVVGAGNRTQQFRGYTLTYDLNGNVTSKVGNGKNWTYTWDPLGQLTAVREAGVLVDTMTYDPWGRRVFRGVSGQTDELYVYDGGQVTLDVAAGTGQILRDYGWEPGTDRLLGVRNTGGWMAVAVRDPGLNTSILGLANANGGALIKRYAPTAWGITAADTGVVTRFRMAGREYDQESKLYYMRARYYDPDLGRFMSEDPLGVAGGLNLYAYANNDPVNMRDPLGMSSDDDECPGRGNQTQSGAGAGAQCLHEASYNYPTSSPPPPGIPGVGLIGGPAPRGGDGFAPVGKGGGPTGSGPQSQTSSTVSKRRCMAAIAGATVSVVSDALFVTGITPALKLGGLAVAGVAAARTYAVRAELREFAPAAIGATDALMAISTTELGGATALQVASNAQDALNSYSAGFDVNFVDFIPIIGSFYAIGNAVDACSE